MKRLIPAIVIALAPAFAGAETLSDLEAACRSAASPSVDSAGQSRRPPSIADAMSRAMAEGGIQTHIAPFEERMAQALRGVTAWEEAYCLSVLFGDESDRAAVGRSVLAARERVDRLRESHADANGGACAIEDWSYLVRSEERTQLFAVLDCRAGMVLFRLSDAEGKLLYIGESVFYRSSLATELPFGAPANMSITYEVAPR